MIKIKKVNSKLYQAPKHGVQYTEGQDFNTLQVPLVECPVHVEAVCLEFVFALLGQHSALPDDRALRCRKKHNLSVGALCVRIHLC